MFCKHKWYVVSDTITKSPLEIACESLGMEIEKMRGKISIPWQLCQTSRRHTVIVSCNNCGKVKKFSEDIP